MSGLPHNSFTCHSSCQVSCCILMSTRVLKFDILYGLLKLKGGMIVIKIKKKLLNVTNQLKVPYPGGFQTLILTQIPLKDIISTLSARMECIRLNHRVDNFSLELMIS
jgi:hypothetical protein